ncbi:MAG: molybdate ABC transporter substrate-binding protein, partial [Collinsella sp.]|nr:molybdate ABC transporter substrate-binding protein [Collinsella sp.]
GDLVEQMRAGAAVDVLITASKGTMDDAEAAELVDADTREDMFVNDLVIIRAEGSDTRVEAIADVANLDGKIAIGDAKIVPAGKYANQALASVGLYTGTEGDDGEYTPDFADKVALADKVGTAASYVSTGDCVAGFVYSSDIFRYDGIEEAFVCPEDSHKTIVYPGAVADSSEHADEAKAFIDFCLTNKKAQKIWAKYGFELSA